MVVRIWQRQEIQIYRAYEVECICSQTQKKLSGTSSAELFG